MLKNVLLIITTLALSGNILAANNSSAASLQRRITMLENALAPKTPQATAQTWAQAVQNRNGAVQYMLLCPALQQTKLADFENLNWVTGTSTPVTTFQVIDQGQQQQTSQFDIRYNISGHANDDHLEIVKVDPRTNSSQQWCIQKFNLMSP